MKTNLPAKQQSATATAQPLDVQRRINAGWLRLWRTAYPHIPPPTVAQGPHYRAQGSRSAAKRLATLHPQSPLPLSRRSPSASFPPVNPSPCLPVQGSGFEVQGSPVRGSRFKVQGSTFDVQPSAERRPATLNHPSSILALLLVLALLATGCAGPRPLKGGRAVTTHKPGGIIEQTLIQSQNPNQPTKQDQETIKVRTYTLPAGTRIEQVPLSTPRHPTLDPLPSSQPSTLQRFNVSPSSFVLASPMPVVEREETRARTELGAAQKDPAREFGAKLASLKGIVWVGVGLFVFGLASLVWPPLKAIIGSVTTSAALMLGGVALMVLPSLVVGNELLILGGVGVAVGGWFLAHRHGQLRGLVAASTTPPPTPPAS